MRVDITYRIVNRNQRSFLRLRFRAEDGRSAVAMYGSPIEFISQVDSIPLGGEVLAVFHEDLNILSSLDTQTYYRGNFELSPHTMQALKVSTFGPPQEFEVSFSKIGDRADTATYRLRAKEWGVSDRQSLEVTQEFSMDELIERLGRVHLQLSAVRDQALPGSSTERKITEDEIELLFDPAKPDEIGEIEELDLPLDL